jgi:hypothetical protein
VLIEGLRRLKVTNRLFVERAFIELAEMLEREAGALENSKKKATD